MVASGESFAWAYRQEAGLISPQAEDGLRYARRLAEMAREYRKTALTGEPPPFPLTPADIAREEDLSERTVRKRIALARFELYGISQTARSTRARRGRRSAPSDPVRVCKAPDCEEELPRAATKRRAYHHPRCKRRHHYQLTHPEAKRAPHLRGPRPRPVKLTSEQFERVLEVIRRQ